MVSSSTDGVAIRLSNADGTNLYTPGDERAMEAAHWMVGASPKRARPGVRPGGGLTISVATGPERFQIQPGVGVVSDNNIGTDYTFAVPTLIERNITRPGSGTRNDLIIARILDKEIHGGDVYYRFTVDVLPGTPALPTPSPNYGFLVLGQAAVPSSGTIVISAPPQRTVASGGILPVASTAERDALVGVYDGLQVYVEDIDTAYLRVNGAWAQIPVVTPIQTYTPTWTAPTTNPVVGNGALVGSYTLHPNKILDLFITLTIGSTTTLGSGAWSFTLPSGITIALTTPLLTSGQLNRGTTFYPAKIRMISTSAFNLDLATSPQGATLGTTVAWATGDTATMALRALTV
ncbi:MAG: hypothetical protein JWO46_1800 [Nocardioidaceae bacterium]|nr:hypothetical protein [Nocardioidaceae bacterium]